MSPIKESLRQMNNKTNKKYLYPAGGAYFSAVTIAALLLGCLLYSVMTDVTRFLMIGIAEVPFVCALISLIHVSFIESNMMILAGNTLFFYGMDKVELVPYTQEGFDCLLKTHQALFDRADVLEVSPKSSSVRKLLYMICIVFIMLGVITSCYNFHVLYHMHFCKLLLICALLSVDILLLVNRLCHRSSMRYFWGNFHKSIACALVRENAVLSVKEHG